MIFSGNLVGEIILGEDIPGGGTFTTDLRFKTREVGPCLACGVANNEASAIVYLLNHIKLDCPL